MSCFTRQDRAVVSYRFCDLRRDKYQKKLIYYWVDIRTTGVEERKFAERLEEGISAEGDAPDDFEMGGMDEPLAHEDDDASASDEDDAEDDEDGDDKPKRRAKRGNATGFGREHALEASGMYMCMIDCSVHLPSTPGFLLGCIVACAGC